MTDQSFCRHIAIRGEPCTVFFDKSARSFCIAPVYYRQEFVDRPGRYDHIADLDWLPNARPASAAGSEGPTGSAGSGGAAEQAVGDNERDEGADEEEEMDLDGQAQDTAFSPQSTEKIPRPPNAWILFRKEKSKELHQANPRMSAGEISTEASRQWKAMSVEERAFYHQMAETAAQQHKVQYPDYRYKPARK